MSSEPMAGVEAALPEPSSERQGNATSVNPQCSSWIEAHGAQCRNENRNDGNEEQQACHSCECQRVKRRNVEEQAAKRARHEGRGNQPQPPRRQSPCASRCA